MASSLDSERPCSRARRAKCWLGLSVALVLASHCASDATTRPNPSGPAALGQTVSEQGPSKSDGAKPAGPTECSPCRAAAEARARANEQTPAREFLQLTASEQTWAFEDPVLGPIPVVVSIDARHSADQRLPVLITFHGRGESKKGPERGVRGWLDDYGLGHAIQRLHTPPLTKDDFQGFIGAERLREHNARLAAEPYRPLIVVMPYLPDVLKRAEAFDNTARLASLIVDQVLARVYAETPADQQPRHTGIDGISLGGRASLLIGLSRAAAFGAVGTLQAAIDESEIPTFTRMAQDAMRLNPALQIRLLSSRDDAYLDVNQQLHASLQQAGINATLDVVRGPHNYNFNRGPGCYEMLLFQEAALYR